MSDAPFDPIAILGGLTDGDVRFVVIGGFAAALQGWPGITQDLDVCYARDDENLERLAAVLASLEAKLRVAGDAGDLRFPLDARALRLGDTFTLTTRLGSLDIVATPAGTSGYEDLAAGADRMDLGEGLFVSVASIDDLIRMKRASGRAKDRAHLEDLGALREESRIGEER